MKNILVPIDFSQHSKAAFEVAYDMALKNQATLNLFHVVENPKKSILLPELYLDGVPTRKNFNDNLIALSKEKIQKWVSCKSEHVVVIPHAAIGNLTDEFKKFTKKNLPDLVVMGVKGYNDANTDPVGSFTAKMIKKLEFPVLTVKAGFKKEVFNKLMMVADFNENEASIAFEVKRLHKMFKAPVEIVRINTPQDFETDRVLEKRFQVFQEKYMLENCSLFNYNHINREEGIILAAKKLKADLVVIASQSKSVVERLLPYSNENAREKYFIDYLEYPIWIFQPHFKMPAKASLVQEIKLGFSSSFSSLRSSLGFRLTPTE